MRAATPTLGAPEPTEPGSCDTDAAPRAALLTDVSCLERVETCVEHDGFPAVTRDAERVVMMSVTPTHYEFAGGGYEADLLTMVSADVDGGRAPRSLSITTNEDVNALRDAYRPGGCNDLPPEESCVPELGPLDEETRRRAETILRRRLQGRLDQARELLGRDRWCTMSAAEPGGRYTVRTRVARRPVEEIPVDVSVHVELLRGDEVVLDWTAPVECAAGPDECRFRSARAWVREDRSVAILEVVASDFPGNGLARHLVARIATDRRGERRPAGPQ